MKQSDTAEQRDLTAETQRSRRRDFFICQEIPANKKCSTASGGRDKFGRMRFFNILDKTPKE